MGNLYVFCCNDVGGFPSQRDAADRLERDVQQPARAHTEDSV